MPAIKKKWYISIILNHSRKNTLSVTKKEESDYFYSQISKIQDDLKQSAVQLNKLQKLIPRKNCQWAAWAIEDFRNDIDDLIFQFRKGRVFKEALNEFKKDVLHLLEEINLDINHFSQASTGMFFTERGFSVVEFWNPFLRILHVVQTFIRIIILNFKAFFNETLFSKFSINYNNESEEFKKGSIIMNNKLDLYPDFRKNAFWESVFSADKSTSYNNKVTYVKNFELKDKILKNERDKYQMSQNDTNMEICQHSKRIILLEELPTTSQNLILKQNIITKRFIQADCMHIGIIIHLKSSLYFNNCE